jgi:hypothetical protein
MNDLEIANLNDKGQLTLPENMLKYFFKQNIRKFAIISIGDSFTLKPIENNTEIFMKLAEESNEFILKTNVSQEDLPNLIKQVRNEYSN